MTIDSQNGLINWLSDPRYVSSVSEFNNQCYVVPTGSVEIGDESSPGSKVTYIAPLFKQVKKTLEQAGSFVAETAYQWDKTNQCLGCHVQTQTLVGLETSLEKADVDPLMVEYFLNELLTSQQSDGSIRRSHPEYSKTQTVLALWALENNIDRQRTLDARASALQYLQNKKQTNTQGVYWSRDHDTAWLTRPVAINSLVAQSIVGYIQDYESGELTFNARQLALLNTYKNQIDGLTKNILNATEVNNLDLAFKLMGLAEAQEFISDEELKSSIQTKIQSLDARLRSLQQSNGGWSNVFNSSATDPMVSAFVGIALDYNNPAITDTVVLKNIQYLLNSQRADGTWTTNTGLFTTSFGPTSAVMTYLPIALEHLGNPDLRVGDFHLKELADNQYELSVDIKNRGLTDVKQTTNLAIYSGMDPTGNLIARLPVSKLGSAESTVIKTILTKQQVENLPHSLYAELQDLGELDECEIRNNFNRVALVNTKVTDRRGLFDSQIFVINVLDINAAPELADIEPVEIQAGQIWDFQAKATDEDLGDAHEYELVNPPSGFYIDIHTGQFSTDPNLLEPGAYNIVVKVTDLRGASTEKIIQVTVKENLPPQIITDPIDQIAEDSTYIYDVNAIDPNGDKLRYSATQHLRALDIDVWTGELTENANQHLQSLSSQNRFCEKPPAVSSEFLVQEQWHWNPSGASDEVYGPAIVVQLTDDNQDGLINSDDNPDIVFNSKFQKKLVAVDGKTGATIWQNTTTAVTPLGSPAAADINGDGIVEIITTSPNRNALLAFNHLGQLLWSKPTGIATSTDVRDAVSIADLDADDDVEIVLGRTIFDHLGNVVVHGNGSYGGDQSYGILSIVADINLDGFQEIIAANTIYNHLGQRLFQNTSLSSTGFNAIGNFDSDDFPEIVLVGSGKVYLLDHEMKQIWVKSIPGGGNGGAPTIGDMDGDGIPEIGVAGGANYVVFKANGTELWRRAVTDTSSSRTGSAVFDFQGDGRVEVVYADEDFLRIFDGRNGNLIYSRPNQSGTTLELPVIADIDNDGAAEILFGGNDSNTRGLYALESAGEPWAPTRSIWNQHAYHITNINDDGSVPQHELPSWLIHNTYRLNNFSDRHALAQADLSAFHIQYDDQQNRLSVLVKNRGLAPANKPVTLEFISQSPRANDVSLGQVVIQQLNQNDEQRVFLDNITPDQLRSQIKVQILSDNTECIANNNFVTAGVVNILVKDEAGLSDTQTYTYSTLNKNEAPVINSSSATSLVADQPYEFQVTVDDPNWGDAHRYSIKDAPEFLTINKFSGKVSADANKFVPGLYNYTLVVEDIEGLESEQLHTLTVTAPDNTKPEFITEPPLTHQALSEMRYAFSATDVDGDEIVYALTQKPQGALIDETTQEVIWTPTRQQLGLQIFEISAVDARGASNTQRFAVDVIDPYANNQSPQITSKPSGAVVVGREFNYQLIAIDPDADPLSYRLIGAQGNMALSTSGLFTWVPQASMAGRTYSISLEVSDGRGGLATQNLNLPVNQAANTPPQITSQPISLAEVDKLYQYQVIASDVDGELIGLSLLSKPNGMAIDENGLINWTPSSLQANQIYSVVVQAKDARGAMATQTYSVSVNLPLPPNKAPYFISSPTSPALVGEIYQYQAKALDPDGDLLTYALESPIDGMSISSSGLVTWSPTAAQLGDHNVLVSVRDKQVKLTQSFVLTVDPQRDLSNQYPEILSKPAVETVLGDHYLYQLVATDADNDSLSYELLNGPNSGVSLSANGLLSWMPASADPSIQNFRVKVSDGKVASIQSWSVKIWAQHRPLELFVTASPDAVLEGEQVTISAFTTGGSVAPTLSLKIDGQSVPLNDGIAEVIGAGFGRHIAEVTAISGSEILTVNSNYLVRDPSDNTKPVVDITSPADATRITAPTPIIGSVQDDNLVSYELYVSLKDKNDWSLMASGSSPVTAGQLAVFDPTMLMNGAYDLRLEATDVNGQKASDSTVVIVDGELKVGNYSISFEDLNVDLAGLPIQVTRTYDTRQRGQKLDFGYGWSVDYQNVRVTESRKLGFSWNLNYYRTGLFGKYCVEPNGNPVVSITLPDGKVEKFKARANPECSQLVPTIDVTINFEPLSGTRSSLKQTDFGVLQLASGNLLDLSDDASFDFGVDPTGYELTTAEGVVYQLDQNFGIRKILEPSGQSITYSSGGIKHSLGYEVKFERDSLNRITALVLPDARRVEYSYNLKGDLESVTDLSGQKTYFDYWVKLPHYLNVITDPRGVTATRMEYDDAGRLTAIIDAEGNRMEYDHNIAGRTSAIRDLRGNTSVYVYDDEGRVLSETNALGETTLRTYNAVGDTLSETNALGETTSWTYDAKGNQLTEKDPLGNVTNFTYNSKNQALTEKNALGITQYTNVYNAQNLMLTSTTDAMGNNTSFAWDTGIGGSCQTGASRGYTDALGNTHSIQPLCAGPNAHLPSYEINAEGIKTSFKYDSNGRKTRETTTRKLADNTLVDLITQYEYDNEDRVIKTTYPDGTITQTEYNAIDKVSAEIDVNGQRTEYEYDNRGNEIAIHYPDGTSELKTWDATGNLLSETDRSGLLTTHEYDAANRKTATVIDGVRTATEYNAAGRVVAEIDANNNRTEYGYDSAGRRTSVKDALGNITQYEYDAAGRMTAMIDALNRRTTYVYNDRDQRIKTIFADGTEVADEFDALSRKTASINQANIKTQYGYDKLGRLIKVIDALNQETQYAYDEQGNKISQTDAEGRITRWEYDNAGRVLKRILPLGQEETFTYSTEGQVLTHTDFNGQTTRYEYDENQRLNRINYADSSAEVFVYNRIGNRLSAQQISATGVSSITSWTYDNRNRLQTETQPNGAVLSY